MYSEDTEQDFNTMDREKQEALLKKTWMEREKQFYGDDIDIDVTGNFSIKEQPENEEDDQDEDSDSGDDLDRGAGNYTVKNLEQAINSEEDETEHTDAVATPQSNDIQGSRYQIMKIKHLESQIEVKNFRIAELETKLEAKSQIGAEITEGG